MNLHNKTAIVIGAGIVGLAAARSLAEKGYRVKVFERNPQAIGASLRNFGMIWPVGQPSGKLYQRALRSKHIWLSILKEAGLWYDEVGSLHLAYNKLEWDVMQELTEIQNEERPVYAITSDKALQLSPAVNPQDLQGAYWSRDEMIIESRATIQRLPSFFNDKYGIEFQFNTLITKIEYPNVFAGNKSWSADRVFVCSGPDFETLYPEIFQEIPITKCKLQMLRLQPQEGNWRIGPSLCGGLSLAHYKSFEAAPSLTKLKEYYKLNYEQYLEWGIHVMVSQNEDGALTIGDTHEYGLDLDPFNRDFLNKMILDYLKSFARFKNWNILQNWLGVYPKLTNGDTEYIHEPESGVMIINGLGGNGMTLSFGLAEEIIL